MAANVFDPEFEAPVERPGFSHRRARIGWQVGSERLGASLYELEPGNAWFPYHWHSNNEEMLVVIAGQLSLRTVEGERELTAGEVVSFPVGEPFAHLVVNRSDRPARFLIVSEMNEVDVNGYPDSGKLVAMTRPPGSPRRPGAKLLAFREPDAVDYMEGEPHPTSRNAPRD